MIKSASALARNVVRLKVFDETYLEPLVCVVYVTKLCNYSCAYCHEYGAHRNAAYRSEVLDTEALCEVLRIVRQGCEGLYITGGEPLLRKDIVDVVRYCRRKLRFGFIGLNTNGSLLSSREALIQDVDSIVVSLDTTDVEKADRLYRMPSGTTARVVETLRALAPRQLAVGFELVVNCVVGTETIDDALAVLEFCLAHGIEFSIQVVEIAGVGPDPGLRGNSRFEALIDRILAARDDGARISGSETYLRGLRRFHEFDCFPSLNPRVDPLGRLYWPCKPLAAEDGGLVDLREWRTWAAAVRHARFAYGDPPVGCHRCYLRCYAELSLLAQRPQVLGQAVLQRFSQSLIRKLAIPNGLKSQVDRLRRGV